MIHKLIQISIFVLLLSTLTHSLQSQSILDSTALFVKTNGSPNFDIGYAIGCDSSGNTYSSGQFRDTITFGSIVLTSADLASSLVKYSPTGAVVWAKFFSTQINNRVKDIWVEPNGTVWVIGNFKKNINFGDGFELLTNSNNEVGFIAKFNSNGTCLRANKIESQNFTAGKVLIESIFVKDDGSILLSGAFIGSVSFESNIEISGIGSIENGFLARFNSSLQTIWAKSITSNFSSIVMSAAFDKNDNVVCVGDFSGTASISPLLFVGQDLSQRSDISAFIAKYSGDGLPIWIKSCINSSTNEILTGIAIDNNNSYYIYGSTNGDTVGISPAIITANHSISQELFIAKVSTLGDGIWSKSYGSSGDDRSGRIIIAPDGNLIIVGKIEQTATFGPTKTLISSGGSDAIIGKFSNSDGTPIWVRKIGAAGNEFFIDVDNNSKFGYAVTGSSSGSFTLHGKSHSNAGGDDIVVSIFGELKVPIVNSPLGTISRVIDTLRWTNAFGADSSFHQIRENDSISGNEMFAGSRSVSDSTLILPALHYGRKYFYRSRSGLVSGYPSTITTWNSFSVVPLPLLSPISPLHLSTSVGLQVGLKWQKPISIVDSVLIQVKKDSIGNTLFQSYTKTRIDTSVSLPTLSHNSSYFWRGKTKASNGDTSAWTSWFTFTTVNYLQPIVVSPKNGAVNRPLMDTLQWKAPSQFIDTVYVQLRAKSSTGFLLVDRTYLSKDSLLITSTIPTLLNEEYVWRIRFGSNQLGAGLWTEWNSFQTILPGGTYNELCASIVGIVTDDGGDSIQNGIVTAWRTDTSQGVSTVFIFTDSIVNGSFHLKVPQGSYLILTTGSDYITKWFPNVSSRADAVVQTVFCSDSIVRNFNVTRNPLSGQQLTIRGIVRSKTTNLPLTASVQMTAVNLNFQSIGASVSTTTDASGGYEFIVPASEKYIGTSISPNHSLRVYDTATAFIEGRFIRSGMTDPLNVHYFLNEIPIENQSNGVKGRMTDSLNNPVNGKIIAYRFSTPAGDTTVQATFFYSVETDSLGFFEVKGLEKGSYKVMGIPNKSNFVPGFYTFTSPFCIPDWNNSTTIFIQDTVVQLRKNIIFRKINGDQGAASWTITVEQRTVPLLHIEKDKEQPKSTITEPGVIITLFDKNGGVSDYAFTDVNGTATSSSLTVGTFEYEASKVGFLPKKGTIIVTANGVVGGTPVIELEKIKKEVFNSVSIVTIDGISVFPNPATDLLIIEDMKNAIAFETVLVQDIRGIEYQIPFDIQNNGARVSADVRSLPIGWYTMLLHSATGTFYSYSFVKE